MFYLEALAQPSGAPRNSQPTTVTTPDVVFARHPNAVTRWIRLKEHFIKRRGGTVVTNRRFVPNTTNSDVLQLATHWSRELAKVEARDAHGRSEHARWKACMETVRRTANPNKPDAVYGKNEAFWQRCSRRLAIYLTSRKAVPSKWTILKEAVAETLSRVPGVVGDATKTTAGLISDTAGGVAKVLANPARAAMVVVGAAILLPPLIRAVRK